MTEVLRGSQTGLTPQPAQASAAAWAFRLEIWTAVWLVFEAGASIVAGLQAGSLLLAGFGADSVIELLSAGILLQRLHQGLRGTIDHERLEAMERRAAKLAAYLLYVLCLYLVLQSVWGLTQRHAAEASWPGIAIAVFAAVGMPLLARAKLRAADRIGSRALRADAIGTLACGYLSWVLLVGLVADAVLHWWWLDAVAALVMVPLLIREAREAERGECGCDAARDLS